MFSFTSVFFLLFGGVFVLVSVLERWILINWYRDMSESSWFFWGMNLPYIENPDGVEEFVKYRAKVLFILGGAHLLVGAVLIPFPDFLLLPLFWVLLLIPLALALRAGFIDVALEINRKYARMRPSPKKGCPKCGREMWLDFKICPGCGESLYD